MKKTSKANRVHIQSYRRAALIAGLLIGIVGVYLLFKVSAAWDQPGQVYLGSTQQTTKHQSGETITLTLYGNTYNVPSESALYLTISFDSVDSQVTRQGQATCNPGGVGGMSCSGGPYGSSPSGSTYTSRDANYCIKFDQSTFGRTGLSLFSVTYTTQKASPYNFGANYSWSTGSCNTNGYISGIGFTSVGAGYLVGVDGSTPGGCSGSCGGGQNPGGGNPGGQNPGNGGNDDGTQGSGSGTTGQGSGKTGTGTGGGSSGSTATKNGNDPNSTPSSSNQGDKNQTKLDPSPFYDGKQYSRGSESDSSLGGLFKKPRDGGIAVGWYLVTALVLLAAGGGMWWKKKYNTGHVGQKKK